MKNYLNHLSLAQKLTFLTLLITIACSAAIMGCVYYFILHLSDDNLSEELKTRQSFIQKAYIEPLSKVDKVQISEVSQSLLLKNGYSYVAAIRVVDSNENVLYLDSTFENKQSSIESYAKLPFTKMGVSEIRKEGKLLGRVSVVFTSEAKMKKYQGILSGIFLASSLFVVFTCVWIYFFFNNILTYPLNKLLEHVKQLKSENYETRDYADIPHELELIGNTLNYASSLIKKRNDDFKHHSEDLEKMVEDRTCE
ncbi:MAG: hypothetical protein ACXVCE_01525, partial [Bacteriovorax sp.]